MTVFKFKSQSVGVSFEVVSEEKWRGPSRQEVEEEGGELSWQRISSSLPSAALVHRCDSRTGVPVGWLDTIELLEQETWQGTGWLEAQTCWLEPCVPSEKGLCAVAVCMTDGQLAGKNEERLGTPSEGVVSQGKARFRQALEESGRQLVQRRLAFTHEHPRHFELVLLHRQQ